MALSQPQLALLLCLFSFPGLCLVADANFTCPCGEGIRISLADLVPCYERAADKLPSPRSCDAFIYVSTIQALVYMTSYMTSFMPNLPLVHVNNDCYVLFQDIPTYENRLQEALPEAIGEIYDEIKANITVGGIIGPQDQELSELISYITGNKLKKLTVSYSTPNFKLSNHTLFPNLYSTATSDLFLNKARLQLLYDFSWRKVAVVATDALYDRAQNFYTLASKNLSMELSFPGTFRDDPTNILSDYKENNYRIFMAFIPFESTRYVICKAIRLGLTTSQHVWILPGIYEYMWWHDCTCGTHDEFCSCNECTEDEMKAAIQGMLFIDASNLLLTNSTESEAQINSFHWIFNVSRDLFFTKDANITEDDRQYLLHSHAPNAYDAVVLWTVAWHAAVEDLLNKSNDTSATCAAISSNNASDSELLTEKMLDILEHSVYCGVSGHYTYSRNNKYEEFGQAIVTQFQYDSECSAGLYTNYNVSCDRLTLIPIDDSQRPNSNLQLQFLNFSSFQIDSRRLIVPCPYRWKNRMNGSFCLDCYTAPTDGVCRDDSCICYNELNVWTMSIALSLMIIGILLAIFLLILNFAFRNNMHFKSSTPIFNVVIIIGSILMYLSVLFLVFSFTGSRIAKTEEQRGILLPISCEFTSWLLNLGMVLILSTLLARNWRLYRIFNNSKIINRNNLSNAHLACIIILLTSPMVLLLIISTAVSPSEYITRNETDSCPHLNVDDSITTTQITYLCSSSTEWKEIHILYNLLLSCGLIFFSYQNAKIRTHFSQEGEFAARAVFVVFLFIIPGFLIDMMLLLVSSLPSFWIGFVFSLLVPTIILGGLFIPKLIFINKDKKEETKLTKQYTLTMNYEGKMKEITHLQAVLSQKEANISTLTHSPALKDAPVTIETELSATPASKHVKFDVREHSNEQS